MEIRIKSGEGFCEYTGTAGRAFVKLCDDDGMQSTGWLCAQALQKALKVLGSIDEDIPVRSPVPKAPVTAPQPALSPDLPEDSDQMPPPVREVIKPARSEADKALLASVKFACEDLTKRCEEEKEPVNEVKIFDIIRRFRKRTKNPKIMAPVFMKEFGMHPSRFCLLLQRPDPVSQIDDGE